MDKKERNKVKKSIKKEINRLIGQEVGCSAKFNDKTQTWEVWMSVDFNIPEGLDTVKEGSDKDIQQAEVVAFMKLKETEIVSKLKERFQAVYKPEKENDFNFTQPFPPMISTVVDLNGIPRLKTKEEKERIRQEFPTLVDMLEADEHLLEAGYFEFRGVDGIPEYEGFVLVKYAGLRARYTFIIPQPKEAVLS